MPDVTVTLAHFWTDPATGKSYQPGQKATVSADEARGLYRAGIARSETKADEQTEARAIKEARKAEHGGS